MSWQRRPLPPPPQAVKARTADDGHALSLSSQTNFLPRKHDVAMKKERPSEEARGAVDKIDPLRFPPELLNVLKKSECCNLKPALITLHCYTARARPHLSSTNSQKILNLHSCAPASQTTYTLCRFLADSKGVPGLNQCLISI